MLDSAPRPSVVLAPCPHGCSIHSAGRASEADPFPARLVTPTSGRSAVSLGTLAATLRENDEAPCACVEAWVASELDEEDTAPATIPCPAPAFDEWDGVPRLDAWLAGGAL